MKGDGNGIWNTMKSEMEDSKKLVKSWANNDHHNEQLTNKIYESEEEDEELSHS